MKPFCASSLMNEASEMSASFSDAAAGYLGASTSRSLCIPPSEGRIDTFELDERQVGRARARLFDGDPGRDAGLAGLAQYTDLFAGKLCEIGDLLAGHDELIGKFRCRRCQDHDVVAFQDFLGN